MPDTTPPSDRPAECPLGPITPIRCTEPGCHWACHGVPDKYADSRARIVREHVAAEHAPTPETSPAPAWVDGDPLMEAMAAAVYEQCGTDPVSSIVVDDPRTIAAVAATVARELLGATTAELAATSCGHCGHPAEWHDEWEGCVGPDGVGGVGSGDCTCTRRPAQAAGEQQPAPVPCSFAVLQHPHIAHPWAPQPGMTPVHCPGHPTDERARLRAELDDQRKAKQIAAQAADRFRDVLSEALGHSDENPGDDVLVAELRTHFGRTGPEPTRWRDFLAGAEAIRDQLNAAHREEPQP
ncbi:hypothetical protein [Streptomyces sp. NPDC059076]|uniref:hypothetical protein n=1 Tax=unclassified Streptomyces TaxID=2593676 RepID=UPI0036A47D38